MVIKVAIITTHPIQYNAPFFTLLAQQEAISLKVFYTWGKSAVNSKFDPGFGKEVKWDIPLFEGYAYEFLENVSADPGSHHYAGIDNPAILDRIADFNPSALLVFGWNFKSHYKCLRYFKNKIPVFFRGDSTLLNEKPGLKTVIRRLALAWVYRSIDYALYVGENNKSYFLKHGVKKEQLIYAPHAVDNNRFMEPDAMYTGKAKEWKKKLGIKQNEITVLYAGKLEPVKNPFFLVEVAKGVKELPVKIVIAGNGVLEEELKKAAADLPNVIFLDFQNQTLMPVVYRLGDIFLMCSVSETWGLGVNEAMACGCAIAVSSKVGCAPDLVDDSNGIIFSSGVNPLITLIQECIFNRARLESMKEASRLKINKFTFAGIAHPFIDKLNHILPDN